MRNIQVLEHGSQRMVSIDIQSKLLQENIIMISEALTPETVSEYQAQLFYLASKCKEGDIISLYINSPGGCVYDGLGLYDTIQILKSRGIIIRTINIGMAMSMAAILLMCGTEGYREATKNSTVMIHELSGWNYGKIKDIEDCYKELSRLQNSLNDIIKTHSDKTLVEECLRKDLYLSAESALQKHIIDKIII